MKIIVTGIEGFIGQRLLASKLFNDVHLVGTYLERMSLMPEKSYCVDITDTERLESVILEEQPDCIINLAAQSLPMKSFEEPSYTINTNACGLLNILKAVTKLKHPKKTRIFQASTSGQYGCQSHDDHYMLTEDCPQNPEHPYGWSKKVAEDISREYASMNGLDIVYGRIFNTSGFGKTGDIWGDIFSQLANSDNKSEASIKVGDLSTERAYLFVEDTIEAIWSIVMKGRSGEAYNISGGKHFSGFEVMECIEKASNMNIVYEKSSALFRKRDEKIIYGCNEKITRETGWFPKYSINHIATDFVDNIDAFK